MTLRRNIVAVAFVTACTGPTYDTRPPDNFIADPPAVYVAKVKNILVGQAPTDDEVSAVVRDPKALGGLVDRWMQTPEYQQKMLVFFELAFQQAQVGVNDFKAIAQPNNFVGDDLPLMIQNAVESFARTALQFAANDRPFVDLFTTKQFMLTPALAAFYGYIDWRTMDDNGRLDDQFSDQNPTQKVTIEAAQGPIPLADSFDVSKPNYMHFYNPAILTVHYSQGVCNGVDPVTIDMSPLQGTTNLTSVLYGDIPAHTVAGTKCPGMNTAGRQLVDSDFTAWKLVTIRQPQGSEHKTRFFDLVTMRSSNELVLDTPRVGFFTTPAFMTNWQTNSGNQMRGPLNQTLIVATGHQIDGTDGTIPTSTPGLDPMHTDPGSACYGCHQLLDPTRSIFSKTYSWFDSPQTDAKLVQQPGLFAFQHVVAPVSTIDDFAQLLATHPLVGAAWVQKLCYYINSAPCDPADPEFQRIVSEFANGFSWNGLVRNMFTSPITTNAAATLTFKTNGEVLSVSRKDHLCAAINNRLGFIDICLTSIADQQIGGLAVGPIAAIVSGMPADAYGRGGVAPILPNQPTLFFRGALENVCAYLAQATIDATPNANQPGAKKWSSSDPATAIGDFVSIVMAMTPSDPRSAQATTILTDHFTAAKQQGATVTDALRSTFVAACLSPSFAGIGM